MWGMENFAALASLAVVAAMFALFVLERYPPETVAVGGVAVMLLCGFLETDDFIGVFSNSAPIAIGAFFVLSTALLRTGGLEYFINKLQQRSATRPYLVLPVLLLTVLLASAFMNNTPVVMVLIPAVLALSAQLGEAPSRFLIPLSYAAILGGTCTLIGTSTNLLVDGVARDQGLAPFGLFEITPLGLAIAAAGGTFLAVAGPKLLPRRPTVLELIGERGSQRFLTDAVVPPDSTLIGKRIDQIDIFKSRDVRILDVVRNDYSQRTRLGQLELKAGDRLVLETQLGEVLSLREEKHLNLGPPEDLAAVSGRRTEVVEAVVAPRSVLTHRTLKDHRLRRNYGIYVLAVQRHGENLAGHLGSLTLKPGDALLIEGTPEDIARVSRALDLVNVSRPQARAFRREKLPIALAVLAGVALLAALEVMPIVGLAVIGVAVVLFTRCLDAEEAFSSVDWRILILILAMLGVGAALQETGAVALIVAGLTPALQDLPVWAVLACLYLMTWLLTEAVTNSAIAVVVTPVAVGLATSLGYDPRPFIVIVMFAASASFATPIGYQTNTLVYGPGGYKFTDFLKIGVPMNLIVGTVTIVLTPLIWAP